MPDRTPDTGHPLEGGVSAVRLSGHLSGLSGLSAPNVRNTRRVWQRRYADEPASGAAFGTKAVIVSNSLARCRKCQVFNDF
jgi:hypothetical protein